VKSKEARKRVRVPLSQPSAGAVEDDDTDGAGGGGGRRRSSGNQLVTMIVEGENVWLVTEDGEGKKKKTGPIYSSAFCFRMG
jgi:hypothetical protein